MGELIRPTRVNIITKEGECKLEIVIDLNINLNANGGVVGSTQSKEDEKEEEKTMWAIPTFKSKDKVKFGKKKEDE